ncbi:hypothetical protein CEH05_11480 [Halobacillus halophilus]|uniref:Uncharacterized protein n=1 Tax=Halobacillus halophilus (strain ATCC 35676 / DSM 2266 / JCM 20832 / KCTC 3685 / LMG 17431 / NBRC 102448 / NCIMB 2269) TaxID=866895 RepID=I0JNE2_HALH3|nr:hypothetical protein [Halobacillus halophilus]ASF39724.1 hypothetical protein CEH05_11480 [Halobacillus halophilus]CCG45662.1 hypothetical protein HBHAL_3317 [Halobacillus halophilus DSM 2266]
MTQSHHSEGVNNVNEKKLTSENMNTLDLPPQRSEDKSNTFMTKWSANPLWVRYIIVFIFIFMILLLIF